MKSQSISTRVLKALLLGVALVALLMSFKVSASARETIYPSTTSNTVLTKGFTYKLYYSPSYYSFKSTNKSVATISKNGVITARKKGSCHINVYSKYNGEWLRGFPIKVKKNRYYGPSYGSINVRSTSYGTNLILLGGYTKGKYAVLNLAVVNNRIFKVNRINYVQFNFYVGGKKVISKKMGKKKISVGKYKKKKLTVKIKLNSGERKNLDWNRMSLYMNGQVRLTY